MPSGKLWPTGEWSLGYCRHRADDDQRFGHLADSPDGWLDRGTSSARESGSPLDLSNVPNSVKPSNRPEKYGKKGITGYGKKMVKSVGALIDKHYPRHRVTFATITMPQLPAELRKELALAWPELVSQLLRWLSRRLEKRGLPKVVCSVSEVQPKRLQESGEAYLHLHLIWLNQPAKSGNWAIDVLNLRSWVSHFLQKRGIWTAEAHVNTDVRPVKGDKASYLAKYCSKGADVIAEFAEDNGWDAVPAQWWNLTKCARDWVKANTYQGREVGELLDSCLRYFWSVEDCDLYRYVYHVEMNVDGYMINVGWRGCFWPDTYDGLTPMLKSV